MLQHADSRLLNAYQFGSKSALAAVNLTQLLSSGSIKDHSATTHQQQQQQHQQQQQQQQSTLSLAQSPLSSEGSSSATPQEICVQSSVWSEFLNGASSISFMGDTNCNNVNLDSNAIPSSATTSGGSSSWWGSRDQEQQQQQLQTQWNLQTTTSAHHANQDPNAAMSELEGGDWSPGQLGCLPNAPEVNEQLSTMALEQNDFSSINTSLVDPEISNNPSAWSSILMGSAGNDPHEQALELTGSMEGLQEALFSKSFMNRSTTDLLSTDHANLKKASESWEFNPLKGAAAAFEMEDMNKQQQFLGSSISHDERMLGPVDTWTSMTSNNRAGVASDIGNNNNNNNPSFTMDTAFGSSQFSPGKIKQEIENSSQFYNMNNNLQMLNDVPSRWGAHSSRLPAMLSQVLPSTNSGSSKAANLHLGSSSSMVMSRSFGNYTPCKAEPYKVHQIREQSSMSQHSSITSQHSYDSKDSHASKHLMEESREVSSDQKRGNSGDHPTSETFFKRPRIEQQQTTPTLPFKATTFVLQVRKEKLGERITALQQLVAPFGKTDTASVLLEAIGCIKFLHEQVQVLSTPYMKNPAAAPPRSNMQEVKGSSSWSSDQQAGKPSKEVEEPRQDLRSRGLCLVPISCTLQVANDNGADLWTANFGGASGK